MPAHRDALGILFITLGFLSIAVMSALGKEAGRLPPIMVTFFQSGISFVLSLPWFLGWRRHQLKPDRFGLHLVRALAGVLSQFLFFVAASKMPLVDDVLLANAAPLFIPLVMLVWLRENSGLMVWMSLLVGFAGVLIILKPGPALLHNPYALCALLAGLCSAVALIAVHRLAETCQNILFYYFLISAVLSAPFAFSQWVTPTRAEWLALVGVGVFMALGQLLIILAYKVASADKLAPFNYTVIVFSAVLGWWWFHEPIGWALVIGAILIAIGGMLSVRCGNVHARDHVLSHGMGSHWRELLRIHTHEKTAP